MNDEDQEARAIEVYRRLAAAVRVLAAAMPLDLWSSTWSIAISSHEGGGITVHYDDPTSPTRTRAFRIDAETLAVYMEGDEAETEQVRCWRQLVNITGSHDWTMDLTGRPTCRSCGHVVEIVDALLIMGVPFAPYTTDCPDCAAMDKRPREGFPYSAPHMHRSAFAPVSVARCPNAVSRTP